MFKNVGKIDKFTRMIGGALLALVGIFVLDSIAIGIVGVLFFLSGATQFCLLYKLLGISTVCQANNQNQCESK